MRLQVGSLASLSGLGIRHCLELWCRSQMWLRPGVAVAQTSSYSSNSTPSLGTSICRAHPSASHLEELVHTAVPRTRAQVPQDSCSSPCDLGHGPEFSGTAGRRRGLRTRVRDAQECWSTPQAFGPWPETPGTVGRRHGPKDTGPNRPGKLIDRAGHRTRGRVTRESWSTPRDVRVRRESSWTAG